MITFNFQTPCKFTFSINHKQWLKAVIRKEGLHPGDISYLFCDDAYLLERNQYFLHHDTFTDIITFDTGFGEWVEGDIMISVDRVEENAKIYHVQFEEELLRVVVHGVLHLCGYGDKSDEETKVMRQKEGESIQLFNEEYNSK